MPTVLDHGCAEQVGLDQLLPPGVLVTAAGLKHWICENARTLRAFLKRVDAIVPLAQPVQALLIRELPREMHKHGDHPGSTSPHHRQLLHEWLQPALAGEDIGLASEAGLPAVADPGSSVVRHAHALGIPVRPLPGPSSILLALAASGLNGQDFAFTGYLPRDPGARRQRIRELERRALASGQTQLFIETPYRNAALLLDLVQVLQPQTQLVVAAGLTLPGGMVISRSVRSWRKEPAPEAPVLPAVFAIGR